MSDTNFLIEAAPDFPDFPDFPRLRGSQGKCLSKKMFAELLILLKSQETFEQKVESVKEMFNFDPDAKRPVRKSVYNKDAIDRYRDKKKAEGVSTYVSSGNKSSYLKKKAAQAVQAAASDLKLT